MKLEKFIYRKGDGKYAQHATIVGEYVGIETINKRTHTKIRMGDQVVAVQTSRIVRRIKLDVS